MTIVLWIAIAVVGLIACWAAYAAYSAVHAVGDLLKMGKLISGKVDHVERMHDALTERVERGLGVDLTLAQAELELAEKWQRELEELT